MQCIFIYTRRSQIITFQKCSHFNNIFQILSGNKFKYNFCRLLLCCVDHLNENKNFFFSENRRLYSHFLCENSDIFQMKTLFWLKPINFLSFGEKWASKFVVLFEVALKKFPNVGSFEPWKS